jgi:hypothetical protein
VTPAQMRDLLPVAQAYAEGRVVQWRAAKAHLCEDWRDYKSQPGLPFLGDCFGTITLEWRIKPTPREWWLCLVCGAIAVANKATAESYCSHDSHSGIVERMVKVREVVE